LRATEAFALDNRGDDGPVTGVGFLAAAGQADDLLGVRDEQGR